jgi:hypothetical protein
MGPLVPLPQLTAHLLIHCCLSVNKPLQPIPVTHRIRHRRTSIHNDEHYSLLFSAPSFF